MPRLIFSIPRQRRGSKEQYHISIIEHGGGLEPHKKLLHACPSFEFLTDIVVSAFVVVFHLNSLTPTVVLLQDISFCYCFCRLYFYMDFVYIPQFHNKSGREESSEKERGSGAQ